MAVLLNEEPETLQVASTNDFRCFTSEHDFKRCVQRTILAEAKEEENAA